MISVRPSTMSARQRILRRLFAACMSWSGVIRRLPHAVLSHEKAASTVGETSVRSRTVSSGLVLGGVLAG